MNEKETDLESVDVPGRTVNAAQIEVMEKIFGKNQLPIDDLLELAMLVEDESDENDLVIDHNFEFESGS